MDSPKDIEVSVIVVNGVAVSYIWDFALVGKMVKFEVREAK